MCGHINGVWQLMVRIDRGRLRLGALCVMETRHGKNIKKMHAYMCFSSAADKRCKLIFQPEESIIIGLVSYPSELKSFIHITLFCSRKKIYKHFP